jgi:hypothetical protein
MSTSTVGSGDLQQHPGLYFYDGNLVLAAPHASGYKQLFCVHQSVLSSQSAVFADMLSLPNPETDTAHNETYDGKPLVMMPDSAEDLAILLKALYDPTFVTVLSFPLFSFSSRTIARYPLKDGILTPLYWFTEH